MRGFTILEALISCLFTVTIVLSGYDAFDQEHKLYRNLASLTFDESESNYRLSVLRNSFHDISAVTRKDLYLSHAPIAETTASEIKISVPLGQPFTFERVGANLRISGTCTIQPGSWILAAGVTAQGAYASASTRVHRCTEISSGALLATDIILEIVRGSAVQIDRHTIFWQAGQTYWRVNEGQNAPFFQTNRFEIDSTAGLPEIYWQKGRIESVFHLNL